MNSFDNLRKRDREELAKKKAHEQNMESAQRMYDALVRRCLRKLGEYWFGTTHGFIFSKENYTIENSKPGEWALHEKMTSDYYESRYIIVRYNEEPDSDGYFSAIEVYCLEHIVDKTENTSEDGLQELMVRIGEKCEKPTKGYRDWGD